MPVTHDKGKSSGKSRSQMRIAIVGECGVGKTSIVRRFLKQYVLADQIKATIGVSRSELLYHVDGAMFVLNILDMAGSQHFEKLIKSYLLQADAVIFVYDITDKESFAMLPVWNMLVSNNCARDVVKFLVGNKKDLCPYHRQVRFGNAKTYANFEGMVALEVSARDDDSIDLIFQCAAQELKTKYGGSTSGQIPNKTKTTRTAFQFTSLVRRFRGIIGSKSS